MDTLNTPIKKGPGLYEFLVEAELQHYFNSFKNDLKVTHPSQLKFATDGDLAGLGMSKPEVRRLRKYYEKHFPHNYLSKFKKLLSVRKQDNACPELTINNSNENLPTMRSPRVPSKHIIPAANITVNKELGMGEFGVVQQGVWSNEGERIQVAIKCLARERMQTNTIEFLKEAAIMHSIDHPHIVRLFGVVLDTGSLMLVTELAPLRSLLECLKEPSLRSSFPVLTLCDFAVQICDGMQYLEAKRLIHRDLAARNILVFSKNKVKISDFGLSRALGQGKDYYQTNFNVNLKLPIAWCAPECISYLRFTTASDVWAFGVTLWEMFSYGFQPWAALTGQQILEAIDDPNFQRLEQPDCCPQEYYVLMLDCWRHEAATRPRFSDLGSRLIDCRPEQVQAKSGSADGPHMLPFRVGDVITVLDKVSHRPLWKGITAGGKTGLFNPASVVAYLGSDLPAASFIRTDSVRTSARRKLRSEMISAPQGDFKHTGHVGLDGAYFGDLSFLGGSKVDYSGVPTQVVTPFRPHRDLEAAPLLEDHIPLPPAPDTDHEYHEISDEENTNCPALDLGPSLMAEMEIMLSSLGQPPPSPADHEGSNKTNELRERLGKPRKQATVKPISAQDQKTLDTAIALATEISTRSMNDIPPPITPVSPTKRKFSFRFPSSSEHDKHDKNHERRNFSEEAHSTPDLQQKLRCSLNSLDHYTNSTLRLPLWDKASAEFYFAKSRELLTKPFPSPRVPYNSCRDLNDCDNFQNYTHLDNQMQDLSLRTPFYRDYRDRTLTKSESMSRKTYSTGVKNQNRAFFRNPLSPPHISYHIPPNVYYNGANVYHETFTPDINYDDVFVYENHSYIEESRNFDRGTGHCIITSQESLPKKCAKTVRERNLRRQSYNPQAYADTSSSDSDCMSLGSVDLDWRRRRRLRRMSTSNSSIRSELGAHARSKVTQEAQRAYQSLVENRETDMSQLLQVTNPLKVLRSGHLPLVKPRLRTSTLPTSGHSSHIDRRSIPDDFEIRDTPYEGTDNAQRNGTFEKDDNPIPLPPRDRNKTLLTSKPRHTRKHPLIIPASATLQRTLDKVTLTTPPPIISPDPFYKNAQEPKRNYDTESLHFEEQIDSELAALDLISDQDCVDGSTRIEHGESKVQSHHVSCEDLLEFADAKPSSRARGNESDEVRIMSKVLGKDISKEQCLSALEYCDWEVLKAIKLVKVQRLATGADLAICRSALDDSAWDVTRAAQWILSQDNDVLQV